MLPFGQTYPRKIEHYEDFSKYSEYTDTKSFIVSPIPFRGSGEEFADILSRPFDALHGYVSRFSRKDVPALFWFASCWAGWIGMTTDSVQAVADLPKAVLLMERVLELDETYQFGGPHLFMGIYKSATPKASMSRFDLKPSSRSTSTSIQSP